MPKNKKMHKINQLKPVLPYLLEERVFYMTVILASTITFIEFKRDPIWNCEEFSFLTHPKEYFDFLVPF